MSELESILHFLEELFGVTEHPDYPEAMNGLQVEGASEIRRLAAAVDASAETISEAARRKVDFLLVHHGLFWGGLRPITGPTHRKVATLIKGHMSLYSLHLPLDAHEELGNNVLLLQEMGLEPEGRFASFHGAEIGWWARAGHTRSAILESLQTAVEGEVRLIPGGPEAIERIGVVSGGGASSLGEAAAMGLDALITGEAPHHAYHDAMELGLNLFLGGHYATETFGVKALAARLSQRFKIPWEFIHFPTGL
jgi:dinuclear metal center YbgI/SA1388 family protein